LEQRVSEGMGMIDNELKRRGIGYACKKGAKSAPNQDDFFILIDGDTTILGVFDGHGLFGHYCSYAVQQLFPKLLLSNRNYRDNIELALKETFLTADEALRGIAVQEGRFSADLSGTTATIIVHRNNELTFAHVGDSRAVLSKMTTDGKLIAEEMTHDHSPENGEEQKRIEQSGGEVRKRDVDAPARVFCIDANYPGLAMSRAIGDTVAKSFGVIAEPEISTYKVERIDNFIILATDGVWEFLEEQDIASRVYMNGKERADKSAANIVEYAFSVWLEQENNTTDDITCIIYYLN
jgi:serine/threonine protein phosphatase PrpC